MQIRVEGRDVSPYAVSAQWSGNIGQPARTLRVEFIRGVEPETGDRVDFAWDGENLFTGTVMLAERTREGAAVECMDAGVFLANNQTYREYRGTPQAIAAQVCAEFGVPAGELAAGRQSVTVTSTGNMTAYRVLVQAYEGEHPAVRRYRIGIENGALTVAAMAKEPAAALRGTVTAAEKSCSIREMVNRVVIVKDARKIGEANDPETRQNYGTFQKTYTPQSGENPAEGARVRLQGPVRRGSVSALGDIRCVTGAAVRVDEPRSGLVGVYGIESDSHRFDPMGHTMQLELRTEENA